MDGVNKMNGMALYKMFHPILWILVGAVAAYMGIFIQDNNLMRFSDVLLHTVLN